jgi:transcriptional regulator with XRE-family HTH domain
VTEEQIVAHICERLRQLRQRTGLTLEQIERFTNYEFKASVVGAYERGERHISIPRLFRYCQLLGAEPTEILPLGPAGPSQVRATITITGHHLGDAVDWLEAFRSFAVETGTADVQLQVA